MERLRALPGGFKITHDAEGWPVIPGRLGRIEWFCDGVDCHACPLPGEVTLAVYTDRRRMHRLLLALPGVRSHQRGDDELRAVFLPEALAEVARVIRARRKRRLSPEQARILGAETAYRATSQAFATLVGAAPGV
jgi:hypothetical protein